MIALPKDYASNVFINCPFDPTYQYLFEAIVFAIHDCGFLARCAREEADGGNVRIIKIIKIIDECKFGIHDISKAGIDETTELARFNMPLELGLFIGANKYAARGHYNTDKKTLVMDIDQYRYQKFISDLAGQDITSHGDDPIKVITNIRDFLLIGSKRKSITSGKFIAERFQEFQEWLPNFCEEVHWDRSKLTFFEYVGCVQEWIDFNIF